MGSRIRGIRHSVPSARLEFIGELLVALLDLGERAELRAKAWLAGGTRGQRASAIAPGPRSPQACCKALPQFRGFLSGVCEGAPATFLPVVTRKERRSLEPRDVLAGGTGGLCPGAATGYTPPGILLKGRDLGESQVPQPPQGGRPTPQEGPWGRGSRSRQLTSSPAWCSLSTPHSSGLAWGQPRGKPTDPEGECALPAGLGRCLGLSGVHTWAPSPGRRQCFGSLGVARERREPGTQVHPSLESRDPHSNILSPPSALKCHCSHFKANWGKLDKCFDLPSSSLWV